jgi:hypothetical protein
MRDALLSFCAAAAVLVAGPALVQAAPSCNLGNGVKHIVYLQFDNVHLHRDSPNVPSDLEQIPSLLNFLQDNGTLLANHHTPLISHTAVDIVTSLTGVYGEKFGFSIGNDFGYFDTTKTPQFTSAFAYWTDLVNEGTKANPVYVPQMVDQRGKVHPAPWVPFTRAGCDYGAFSTANIELENTTSDVDTVFGPNSPEHKENLTNPNKAAADFEGIAVHCAQNSAVCSRSHGAKPDVLKDEPGGYDGFLALYGNKFVAPAINKGLPYVDDLNGNPITDSSSPPNYGFPGFDPTPSQSLGYAAQMLEAGVPVVTLYIEDAHDNQFYPGAPPNPDGTFGPGEAGYVYQLKAFDAAFSKFFARLKTHGMTPDNTLFVITADEGDHFAGSVAEAAPKGCDGVTVPCAYPPGAKGEVQGDLSRVFATEFDNTTPFGVDYDDAPAFYLNGDPSQTSNATRMLEIQAGESKGYDPIVGHPTNLTRALADRAELALLHMITHDPARTPNFILFGDPDYYLEAFGQTTPPCVPASDARSCFSQTRNYAWNHGDFQKRIVRTWLGVVGPGVRRLGRKDDLFTDHTDIRPTILSLTGLKDDYAHDGRVIFEILKDEALPPALHVHFDTLEQLASAYEQINAPTGPLGIGTLTGISTEALEGSEPVYASLENKIIEITDRRNDIGAKMITMLENAEFNGQEIEVDQARDLIDRAEDLLARVQGSLAQTR